MNVVRSALARTSAFQVAAARSQSAAAGWKQKLKKKKRIYETCTCEIKFVHENTANTKLRGSEAQPPCFTGFVLNPCKGYRE